MTSDDERLPDWAMGAGYRAIGFGTPPDSVTLSRHQVEIVERVARAVVGTRRAALEEAAGILSRRADAFAERATTIFNGKIVAKELLYNAREIRAMAGRETKTAEPVRD